MNLKLLAKLRVLGFVLYPCAPITTHVTQEMDQNYGPFKTQFLSNLDLIVKARLEANKSLSLQPKFVGLPLFGGIDPESGCNDEVGAFQKAFSRPKCLAAYAKVGAATREGVTCACLNNPQVVRSSDTSGDIAKLCWSVQNMNELSVHALTQAGYNGQLLKATFKKKLEEEDQQNTLPNTQARREALTQVRGHGGRFHATGGMHVTSDDLFISMEMAQQKGESLALEKEKKLH
jgi:hypothetical protein